jgi:hypothetical protein
MTSRGASGAPQLHPRASGARADDGGGERQLGWTDRRRRPRDLAAAAAAPLGVDGTETEEGRGKGIEWRLGLERVRGSRGCFLT